MQAYFIIPVALFSILVSIFLVLLPLFQEPKPTLLALGASLIGIPVYVFIVMETPWRLRPKMFDRISSKLKFLDIYALSITCVTCSFHVCKNSTDYYACAPQFTAYIYIVTEFTVQSSVHIVLRYTCIAV